ncbi:MAG: hypothetical protein JO353_07710, partial [Phycisphaerae bacterium]|nr:hypothetical protein [Phycisphaerae bacterium]
RTHVLLLTPNPLIIGKGDPVQIRAKAVGVIPVDGNATLWDAGSSEMQQLKLQPDRDHPAEFSAELDSISQPFTYRIYLNDGQSAVGEVRPFVRPGITKLEIQQLFPAYAHLAPVSRLPNDLQLLAGSGLSIQVGSSSPLHPLVADQTASSHLILHCKHGDQIIPLPLASTNALKTTDPISVPADATGMSILLVDSNGLSSADPVVYPITILPDRPPTITITFPQKKEQLSTPIAKLIVGLDAKDDFALGHVRLCYRVASADEQTADSVPNGAAASPTSRPAEKIEFDLQGTPAELRGQFPFDLSSLQPHVAEGGSVEWWVEAEDTNNITGPGVASSDHYLTRIASEAEVRASLYGQLSEDMAELKRTADSQRQDNLDLGELLRQRTTAP